MSVRVYELSRELNVSNKELLELIAQQGLVLTNHAASVPDDMVKRIQKIFSEKKAASQGVHPVEQKKETPKKQESVQREMPKTSPEVPVKKESQPSYQKSVEEKKISSPAQRRETPHAQETPSRREAPVVKPSEIVIEPMSVADIAQKAGKEVSEVIITLLKQGVVATKNQLVPEKVVAQLATLYGLTVIQKAQPNQGKIERPHADIVTEGGGTWVERLPIVVVIGHVDHGKTTLLDFIRNTRVAAKEKGGITQHLGAYEAHTKQGDLVFLDTPGHEAFSLMRVRGIKVADIAILVVAADDGVMPQTIEAIKHAKSVGLPIIVAINKIDKATPNQIETVKRQLAQQDLVAEDWGGTVIMAPISAKNGTGISELLDMVVLQSQLMELKANISTTAKGFILESKIQKGRGPVATVICQHGVLKVGDYFVAGNTSGRVSSMVNSAGKQVSLVNPSVPVLVSGFSELPQAGDSFEVMTHEEMRKGASTRTHDQKTESMAAKKSITEAGINLIVKTDNVSSKEALLAAINKLSGKVHNDFHVVHAAVGDISESDILLAYDTKSLIFGLHVKINSGAQAAAQKTGVTIKLHDIIYKLLEELELIGEKGKPVKMVSKKIGEAIVLKVFDIKNLGIVAGAQVKSGRFVRDGKVIIWRGKQKIGEGTIKGLQRDRKAVKEVHTGFECAFIVDNFDQWEADDRVECYQEVPTTI